MLQSPNSPIAPVFMSLPDRIAHFGRLRGADIALCDPDKSLTWKQFDESGNRLARQLASIGVRPGDKVTLLVGNRVFSIELMLAIWRCGAVVAPLSSLLKPETLARMIHDSSSDILITDASLRSLAHTTAAVADCKMIATDELEQSAQSHSSGPLRTAFGPDDIATVIYSSGTTGTPKGIIHTHAARCDFCSMMALSYSVTPASRIMSVTPFYSNGSFIMVGAALYAGATSYLLPKFDAGAFLEFISDWAPTHGFVVPTMCHAIRAHTAGSDPDLSCFEVALTAGAPMPTEIKKWMQKVTDNGLGELWGLTEGVATYLSPAEMVNDLKSVGRPMVGIDLRIVDSDSAEVTQAGGIGEIVGRSGSLCNGYLNRPEETKALKWTAPDGSVYLRTGDIGAIDNDGYVHLHGREKDMLISGGLNVFPKDIEDTLLKHECVSDCAVVGTPHAHWGERAMAFLQLTEPSSADAEQIQEWANSRLEKHQQLVRVVICTEDFPRNALGKVVKAQLLSEHKEANA